MSNALQIQQTLSASAASVVHGFLTSEPKTLILEENKHNPIAVAPTTANVALSTDELRQAALNTLFVNAAGLTAARTLTIGADTVANAKQLLAYFGMTTVGQSSVLRLQYIITAAAFTLSLANTSGTANNVTVSLSGGAGAATQVIGVASATSQNGEIIIQARATNVTAGTEAINFNVVRQAIV
jgi:hypothetical protein